MIADIAHAAAEGRGKRILLPVAIEHVVDGLVGDRPMPAGVLADRGRFLDLVSGPLADSPVAGLALHHQVAHRPTGLFQRGAGIEAVALIEVDVIGSEPGEAFFDFREDVFSRQPAIVGTGKRPVLLVGPEHLVARTYVSRRKGANASPTTDSVEPSPYWLAVSKKLMPFS